MNRMKGFAAMFDLELNEEFKVKGEGAVLYRLGEQGLEFLRGTWTPSTFQLVDFLTGALAIIKKPWAPKVGDLKKG